MPEVAAMIEEHTWMFYVGVFFGPFVQEDAAVIAAASLAAAGGAPEWAIFSTIVAGLTASDLWKYWAGRAARVSARMRRFAEKTHAAGAKRLVTERLLHTLFTVRWIPGTRIAVYVAAGYFRAPFAQFAGLILVTAALYVATIFLLFHAVGMVAGEEAKRWLPAAAFAALAAVLIVQDRKSVV